MSKRMGVCTCVCVCVCVCVKIRRPCRPQEDTSNSNISTMLDATPDKRQVDAGSAITFASTHTHPHTHTLGADPGRALFRAHSGRPCAQYRVSTPTCSERRNYLNTNKLRDMLQVPGSPGQVWQPLRPPFFFFFFANDVGNGGTQRTRCEGSLS